MSLHPEIPTPYLGAFKGDLLYRVIISAALCFLFSLSYYANISTGFNKGVIVSEMAVNNKWHHTNIPWNNNAVFINSITLRAGKK